MLKKESQPWFNEITEKVRARAAAVWIKKLINSDILLSLCVAIFMSLALEHHKLLSYPKRDKGPQHSAFY